MADVTMRDVLDALAIWYDGPPPETNGEHEMRMRRVLESMTTRVEGRLALAVRADEGGAT